MIIPVKRETKLYVRYGDGFTRALKSHVGKNTRRVFVGGKYFGTERKLNIKGGNYPTLKSALSHAI